MILEYVACNNITSTMRTENLILEALVISWFSQIALMPDYVICNK